MDKAWGAYFAGRLHSPDFAADILDEFRANAGLSSASASSPEYAFMSALFDAAIDSGIQVPPSVLLPFEQRWEEPVLVLLALSLSKDREEPLLRFSDTRFDLGWLAANNLLFGLKSQNWFTKTLGQLNITHRFTVVDPGRASPKRDGFGSGSCGDGTTQIPKGFPPITLYTLQSRGGPGQVLLARGPMSVYYRKTVVPTDGQTGFGSCFSVDRMKVRIKYLAALAKMPSEKAEHMFHGETLIPFAGQDRFQLSVKQSLKAQDKAIQDFLQGLQQSEGLSASGVVLRIVPEVDDERQNRTDPLPSVAPWEIVFNH